MLRSGLWLVITTLGCKGTPPELGYEGAAVLLTNLYSIWHGHMHWGGAMLRMIAHTRALVVSLVYSSTEAKALAFTTLRFPRLMQ